MREETSHLWSKRSFRSKCALLVSVFWSLYTLCYLLDLFLFLGIVINPMSHRALSTGLLTILVYLILPAKKNSQSDDPAWISLLLILSTVAGCTYILIMADTLIAEGKIFADPHEMILATLLFGCVLEATRRTTGLIMALLIVFFFLYAVYSDYFPGLLESTGFPYSMVLGWMYLSGEGPWGIIIGIVSTTVAGFIIFGGFLKAVGADTFFSEVALAAAGFMRGGSAKAAVIASTLFGTISGSIAANIATTGQITIPMMKQGGFEKNYAGAVEATASTGGMFMPPLMGATAFLIAEFLQISYWSVCVAAILPALAFYATLFVQIDLEAAKTGLKGLPKNELPKLLPTLISGWQYLLPLALLVFFLGYLKYSAQTSIMYTLGALVAVSFFKPHTRLTPKKLIQALEESARGMTSIIPLCTAIGILVGAIEMTGVGTQLTSEILNISGDSMIILLLMTAFAAFVLGMGMTAVSVYILTVVLLAPALIKSGIEPIAAHMFLFYFGCLSFITPPVCVGAYIASGISGGEPWQTGLRSVCLGFAAFLVPFAFVFNPGILMLGTFWNILSAFCFVALGAVCLGACFENFLLTNTSLLERMLIGVSGLLIFYPEPFTRITGLVLACLVLALQIFKKKQGPAPAHRDLKENSV